VDKNKKKKKNKTTTKTTTKAFILNMVINPEQLKR